ncbi:MAG: hypothetical protein DRQ55_03425 [Planctomycetota bacterium]|nr:MAG: hypothetical protein DRQ55_03425 [Planctomycetota bacterium]
MNTLDAPLPLRHGQREGLHLRQVLRMIAIACGLITLAGLFLSPDRVWGGFLMGFAYITVLALAGPVFLAFLCMAGARWSIALERILVAMSKALPVAGGLGLILLLGTHSLYEWSHPAAVEHDLILQDKAAWLNPTGFALRLVGVFLVWCLFARRLASLSARYAQDPSEALRRTRVRWSAAFIAVVAITFSIASIDWLMSLEPHWFSTMFPLLQFSGLGAAGLAAAILLTLRHERLGTLDADLRDDHLHDLGKLLFSLTLLWVFCWYCQYMLIWYTDMPEETVYYAARQKGQWWLLVQATIVVKWAVPFLALMPRTLCRNRRVLMRISLLVLAGHALDLFVQVGPPLLGEVPYAGLWEIAPVVGAVALFFLLADAACPNPPRVTAQHPALRDSLSYRTP